MTQLHVVDRDKVTIRKLGAGRWALFVWDGYVVRPTFNAALAEARFILELCGAA